MSYPVTPNGTVVLCRQVPLDRGHRNVVDFADAATQASAIRVYQKGNDYTHYSYVEGKLYLEAPKDDIIMCNYMMYRNTGFSNKWFYAFITEINYVNPDTSEIVFEIDDYQTYMFDYQLQRCYVEREHTATDAIGDNLVHENLEIGEYVNDGLTALYNIASPAFIITVRGRYMFSTGSGTWIEDTEGVSPLIKQMGEYTGLQSLVFFTYGSMDGKDMANIFLRRLEQLGKSGDIVSITIVPRQFITVESTISYQGSVVYIEPSDDVGDQLPVEIIADTGAFSYKGRTYTPKNNKLHTHPYKMLYMTTLDGNAKEYRYEFFTSGEPNRLYFWWRGTVGVESAMVAVPMNYKQTGNNYDEKIVLTNFPNIACGSDAWQAYIAQNANKNELTQLTSALTIAGGAIGIAAGLATANPAAIIGGVGGIYSGAKNIAALNAQIADIKAQPDNAHGSQSVPALYDLGLKNIYYTHKQITPEYAEIIDNYFTMFGYACHKTKIPATHTRPNWNYVKTVDCNIVATSSVDDSTGLNAEAMKNICDIYNRGVTIWHSLSVVGHYEYNNQPS